MKDHVLSIDINAARQAVWDEITKLGRVQRAVMNTVLESTMRPGGKLRYYDVRKKRVFVVGEIVEVTPPSRFVHTFMFTTRPETPTLVTWELTEIAGGCRVVLTHSRWTDQRKTHAGVFDGWRDILALLKSVLETGDIPLRTKVKYAAMGAAAFMLPRATRVDEVAKAGW
jgi:uncharacterized protein YndB with AHSA1/START domain